MATDNLTSYHGTHKDEASDYEFSLTAFSPTTAKLNEGIVIINRRDLVDPEHDVMMLMKKSTAEEIHRMLGEALEMT